ncbi:MAG: hypothetical protein ACYDA9_04865 [Terriglobia bacterium]
MVTLVEIIDPPDAFPDYSAEIKLRIDANRQRLSNSGISFDDPSSALVATEDQLLDFAERCENAKTTSTVVLDITALPKRYFCFLVKRFLCDSSFQNVVVTYTMPGSGGYPVEHLSEDPMACDHLPGFAPAIPPKGNTLIVSAGFESLNLNSLLEVYRDKKKPKVILSFPPDGEVIRRQWNMVRHMTSGNAEALRREDLRVIAAWDAEEVYLALSHWQADSDGLTLAPFGPKPHTLGMALFGTENSSDSGLYYTQPKSYNPDYSKGSGITWAYVVKWDGIPCYARMKSVV